MRETEKVFHAFHEYLKKHNINTEELTKEQMNCIFQQFVLEYNGNLKKPKKKTKKEMAEDLFEQAMETNDLDETVALLEEAIHLNPKHLEAKVELACIVQPASMAIKEITLLCNKEEKKYKESGFLEENMGDFYGIVETRPYMRAKYRLAVLYNECGMYKKSEEVCKEILKLNTNDNLGARHLLLSVYAMLCDYDKAKQLYEIYPEDRVNVHLYLAGAAFTSGLLDESVEHLYKVVDLCPDYITIMIGTEKQMKKLMEKEESLPGHYLVGSFQEVLVAMDMQQALFENDEFGVFCTQFAKSYKNTKKKPTRTKRKTQKLYS